MRVETNPDTHETKCCNLAFFLGVRGTADRFEVRLGTEISQDWTVRGKQHSS